MARRLIIGGPYAGRAMDATCARIEILGDRYQLHRTQVYWTNCSFSMEVYKHESMSEAEANRAALAMFIADVLLMTGRAVS